MADTIQPHKLPSAPQSPKSPGPEDAIEDLIMPGDITQTAVHNNMINAAEVDGIQPFIETEGELPFHG
ncbi:hypothetical protein LIER_22894 [Lithospermum erythrorhizon]|uniref:Uncharacterized protein n=1 Tax=Lithospermum erythrorhizon TaxID=34254 RepID=A0AAV3QVG1_LITER